MNKKQEIDIKKKKEGLGKEIAKCRKNTSMRALARQIGLAAPNLQSIEKGVNAPSPEVYDALIKVLNPTAKQRKKMDHLYSAIRGTPPPDVCKIMVKNSELNDAIRQLGDHQLTSEEIIKVKELLSSFTAQKGVPENG